MEYTDKDMLDFLDSENKKKRYTGKCIFRQSSTGRGWRLHETSHIDACNSAREAISKEMEGRGYKPKED